MRYTGENCPYCGAEFTEQDDVVVCPDCGTPHHRVCWFAHGECANTEKHGEGFVWRKSAEPEPEPQESGKEKNTRSRDTSSLDIVCPDCGTACPNGTLRCPECGAMLIPFANPMGDPPLARFKPGFDPEENIKGLKSGDIALFCRSAGASYIKKFRRKCSWNWAAFLFSPFWFFYRKLHRAGAVFATVFILLNLLLIPAANYAEQKSAPANAQLIMTELAEQIADENGELKDNWRELYNAFAEKNALRIFNEVLKPMLPIYGVILLIILLKVVAALTADRLYFKKACAEIRRIRSTATDERSLQLELFRKGGTNIFYGYGSYFLWEILLYVATNYLT